MDKGTKKKSGVFSFLSVVINKMKSSFSVWLLQCTLIILTQLLYASEGTSQSLQYVTGVVLETSYKPKTPFTIKSVYGDFVNKNPFWVQLWSETDRKFKYELVWQARVTPTIGDGSGEWIVLPENKWISLKSGFRLGVMNDEIPGPLLELPNLKSNIILTDIDTVVKDIKTGDKIEFDDLGFPYHMPLYACNNTDCRDVRIRLGRLTRDALPTEMTTQPVTTTLPSIKPQPTLKLTMSTEVTTQEPIPKEMVEDNLFNKATIIGILLGLGLLALILLIVVCVLVGICMSIEKRKQKEERNRYFKRHAEMYGKVGESKGGSIITPSYSHSHDASSRIVSGSSSGGGGQVNAGFDTMASDRSDTSARQLVTRELPEQTIMVF